MRTLKTSEAAAVLNVSPNTLRAWERRFGFPRPRRSPGRHRVYTYAEIASLREALAEGMSISSAVSVARDAFGADALALVGALTSFRADRADAAMEGSLCLRSVERSVEEILLPALDDVCRRTGTTSAAWAFAAGWAESWLQRARRLAPATGRHGGVLIGDASADDLDPTRLLVRALELCTVRSGADTLALPVAASRRIGEAVSALEPDVIVIAGSHAPDDEVARWAYAVRSATGNVPFALFHRGPEPLNPSPARAAEEILDLAAAAPAPVPLAAARR
jgi:MerR family transcriptional regulator, light-induced transcriptional regulator